MPVFNIVTLFPEFFDSPLKTGLMGRAAASGLVSFNFFNPRDFSSDKHRRVDDRPFGGGAGMLMTLQPLNAALEAIADPGPLLLMSPQGVPFAQKDAIALAREKSLTLICLRYEGADARLEDLFPVRPISVCDAVLNGGETASLAVIEAVARLIPGFMGKEESAREESFSDGLLEYPGYTRPETFRGLSAPRVLLDGNHAEITRFRRERSLLRTLRIRPDLLSDASMRASDAAYLKTVPRLRRGRNLSFCLCHYPVFVEGHKTGVSSLTNLDAHDIARISHSYGMGPFFILSPLRDQLEILRSIVHSWMRTKSSIRADRRAALRLIRPVADFEELFRQAETYYGQKPVFATTSANFPEKDRGEVFLSPRDIREILDTRPVIVCLGTARGLNLSALPFDFYRLKPLRFLDENHLSVRSAAAIVADRIIGDFN